MRALKLPSCILTARQGYVTTQAHEGIETSPVSFDVSLIEVTTQAHEGIETQYPCNILIDVVAKKYKLYKSSINKSIHFVQRSLSSSTRGQRVTAQLNLSRE